MRRLVFLLLLFPSAAWAQDPPGAVPADTLPELDARMGSCLPYYPESAYRQSLRGVTKVAYRIGVDGAVGDAAVAQSSGNDALDRAAVLCVSGWRYAPGTKNGSPVEVPRVTTITWGSPRLHSCRFAQPRGISAAGVTTLGFRITAEGKVAGATVEKSSGDDALDKAALKCVGDWRYLPAMKSNKPVEVPWTADIGWGKGIMPVLVDAPPDCVSFASPTAEQRAKVIAPTRLTFLLADGLVMDLKVVRSSGVAALDTKAAACVSLWQYRETVFDTLGAFHITIDVDWNEAPHSAG